MQSRFNTQRVANQKKLTSGVHRVAAMLGITMLFIFGMAEAETESMPGMEHQMPGMEHSMPGMEHSMSGMEHSQHEKYLSNRGAYARTMDTYTIPDIKFVDMNNNEVAIKELLNSKSPIILNFIFTTCTTICPVMTGVFKQVQDKLGPDRKNVKMFSISIDPEYDTPARLKAFANKFGAESQWNMLTGTSADSIALQKAFKAFAGDKMNQPPLTFMKAKGSDSEWLRLQGIASAKQIIEEFEKLNSGNKH